MSGELPTGCDETDVSAGVSAEAAGKVCLSMQLDMNHLECLLGGSERLLSIQQRRLPTPLRGPRATVFEGLRGLMTQGRGPEGGRMQRVLGALLQSSW